MIENFDLNISLHICWLVFEKPLKDFSILTFCMCEIAFNVVLIYITNLRTNSHILFLFTKTYIDLKKIFTEANSWNLNHNQTEKAELEQAPSSKKSPDISYGGYVVNLPPLSEKAEINQSLYNGQYLNDPYIQQVPSSIATFPYPPPMPARSASVLGGRFSPLPAVDQSFYSEMPRVASPYLPTPVDVYPTNSAVPAFPPMHPLADPMFGSATYIGHNRMTPVPQGYEQVTASLQSSLDKLDRESESSIPVNRVNSYKPGRNLSSRLSQSSKASDMSRRLVARMATQV